jgi:hypothetical protein
MTDEVKAALQNWRADPYADNSRSCRYAEILAKAYAAEHPPDDDEPVTHEWVTGLLHYRTDYKHPYYESADIPGGFFIKDNQWLEWWHDGTHLATCKTRGQLRRLAFVLGWLADWPAGFCQRGCEMNYRPATAADIGRDDVEFSETGSIYGLPKRLRGIDDTGWYLGPAYCWQFARVPILPEEAVYSNPEIHCAMNTPLSVHTIRRKLEAGGYAEPEQAVYLDGRYYSTEWIKSGIGIVPQQVEIVK